MIPVLSSLLLVGVAIALLRWSAGRVAAAVDVVGGLDAGGPDIAAAALDDAAYEIDVAIESHRGRDRETTPDR